MSLRQDLGQKLAQKMDPKLIAANTILQLTSLELQQRIEQELSENPALELINETPCPICKSLMFSNACTNCGYKVETVEEEKDKLTALEGMESPYIPRSYEHYDKDTDDPFVQIEAEISLQEHLRWHLRAAAPKSDYLLGNYLIDNINNKGYLDCEVSEVAEQFGTPEAEVERVLRIIQSFDPIGVGARSTQECFLIQINYLKEQCIENPWVESMIQNHWQDLCNHRYQKITSALAIPVEEVEAAVNFIRDKLNIYPANQFQVPWEHTTPSHQLHIKPDVIISKKGDEYEIEVVESREFALRVNNFYKNLYQKMCLEQSKYSSEERKFARDYIDRAELFINNIQQRRHTLYEITNCIIEKQKDFFDKEEEIYLKPFTKVQVAKILEKDVSTVSRATSNKYAQMPNGEIVSFDKFFGTAQSIKEMVRNLIINEAPNKRLSDQEIADILSAQGLKIARRTVSKYREQLKLLPSNKRH